MSRRIPSTVASFSRALPPGLPLSSAWYNARQETMQPALELRNLRKTFGTTVAVDGMDLVVPRGALYGVIGPNGAGKTTCIRMIMSILFPDSGELSVLGRRSALEAKDRIGYLPEERGVYRKMKVGAFLIYMAQLKGVSAEDAAARVPRLLQEIGLPGIEGKRCEDLSKGMLQRVQFVAAIIHQPDLLILDEPFSGLDPVSVRLLREHILEEHRRGATILLSTHVMAQRRRDVPARRDDSPGPQGARRADGRAAASVRSADDSFRAARRDSADASQPASRLSGVERVERGGDDGAYRITLARGHRSGSGHGAAGVRRRAGAHRAGASAARGRVHPDRGGWSTDAEAARALRASLTAAGPKERWHEVSIRRIGLVAGREFLAAVANKGFVIGLLIMPAIIALMVAVFPRVLTRRARRPFAAKSP